MSEPQNGKRGERDNLLNEMRRRLNLFAFGNPMLDISARMSLADVAKLGLQPDEDGSDLDDDAKRALREAAGSIQLAL